MLWYSLWNKRRYPELEKIIVTNSYYAVKYAEEVIKGLWPPAEESLRKYGNTERDGPLAACVYARDIMKKAWPEMEPLIAKEAWSAQFYAEFLKKPFPAGEPAIAKDSYASLRYAQLFNKPFPAGEPAIATNGEYAAIYALEILHKRFELGEPEILATRQCDNCREYRTKFLKQVPTKNEPFGFNSYAGEFVFSDIPSTITRGQFFKLMKISYPGKDMTYIADTIWEYRYHAGEVPQDDDSVYKYNWKEFVADHPDKQSLNDILYEEHDGEGEDDDELE